VGHGRVGIDLQHVAELDLGLRPTLVIEVGLPGRLVCLELRRFVGAAHGKQQQPAGDNGENSSRQVDHGLETLQAGNDRES